MWSYPEERTGGRLRFNSFCGINLAAQALSHNDIELDYVHGNADTSVLVSIHWGGIPCKHNCILSMV